MVSFIVSPHCWIKPSCGDKKNNHKYSRCTFPNRKCKRLCSSYEFSCLSYLPKSHAPQWPVQRYLDDSPEKQLKFFLRLSHLEEQLDEYLQGRTNEVGKPTLIYLQIRFLQISLNIPTESQPQSFETKPGHCVWLSFPLIIRELCVYLTETECVCVLRAVCLTGEHTNTARLLLTSCSMQAAAKSATTRLGFINTSSLYSEPKATCRAEKKHSCQTNAGRWTWRAERSLKYNHGTRVHALYNHTYLLFS